MTRRLALIGVLTALPAAGTIAASAAEEPVRPPHALRLERRPVTADRVPAGTRRIDVAVLRGRSAGRTATLSERRAVRSVVAAVDALAPFPPGAWSCPSDRGPLLRLTFRTAAGRRVARAAVDPSGCGVVFWRRHGQPAHALKGATALVRAVRPLVPFTIGP